jgi:cephalosporin hydroxylase
MTRLYNGIPIGHNKADVDFLQSWMRLYNPQTIVELGTMWGGLTTALYDSIPSAAIATFDHDPSRPHNKFVKLYCRQDVDIWYRRLDLLSGANGEVTKYLGKPGRVFLYCDNGEKLYEMLLYAPYLKSGDMLGVHDWGIEIHTSRERVVKQFRQHVLLYHYLRRMLKRYDLVGESNMCRLWIKI